MEGNRAAIKAGSGELKREGEKKKSYYVNVFNPDKFKEAEGRPPPSDAQKQTPRLHATALENVASPFEIIIAAVNLGGSNLAPLTERFLKPLGLSNVSIW